MKRILICLVCFMALGASELQRQYNISSEKITSRDLFPQAPFFIISSFGENFHLQFKATELEQLFKNQGYTLKPSANQEIKISYQLPWDASKIKEKIKKTFLQIYDSYKPKVLQINLKPLNQIEGKKVSLHLPKIDRKDQLNEKLFKKNRFILMLEVDIDEKKTLQPFYCEIMANLEVFVARQEMRAGEDLDEHSIVSKRIDFLSFNSLPAKKEEILSSSLRSFIKKDQIIFSSRLKPKLMIKRGDLVDVSYRDGGIVIESRFEAMQNGSLGDEVMVRNLESKKQIKIKIIGERRGVVR